MNYNPKDGIILVDKPGGMTSHDVVDFVRRRFRFKKVGHAGTLDPMATGLLILLLGKFTKKSASFSSYDKEYEARLCLGLSTDTGDREGSIIEKKDLDLYTENIKNIKNIFRLFQGEIRQVPPMYSAKKINGEKLYTLARKGIVIKREPKTVTIKEIKILDISMPYVTFYARCSKGTYIRQLAHDIGERIGCGAHLVSLRRTKIGPFTTKEAVPFDKLFAISRQTHRKEKEPIYESILQPE